MEVQRTVDLPGVTAVVGTNGAMVAALACTRSYGYGCPLRLLDTASGVERPVPVPVGIAGYAEGGGFSPDGSLLAAFGVDPGSGTVQLVVVDTTTLAVSVEGEPLSVGEMIGSATWSHDGHWVFFGGLDTSLYAEQATARGSSGVPWKLPLPSSYSMAGL